jgi:hypothetical protein
MSDKLWDIVDKDYVILDSTKLTIEDRDNTLANAQAMNVLYGALDLNEFNHICKFKTAHEIWERLKEVHEGTTMVKDAKLFVYKGQLEKFTMLQNESIEEMFNRLNNIINELKGLGMDVSNVNFSHKFLRALPNKYDTIVTLLVRSNLKDTTPMQILSEILTHDIFKKSQEDLHDDATDAKKKNVAFKAQASRDKDDHEESGDEDEDDEEMTLFVIRFKKFMKKKRYQGGYSKKGQSSKGNPFEERRCFECGEKEHIATNCKNKEEKYSKKKESEGKKVFKK